MSNDILEYEIDPELEELADEQTNLSEPTYEVCMLGYDHNHYAIDWGVDIGEYTNVGDALEQAKAIYNNIDNYLDSLALPEELGAISIQALMVIPIGIDEYGETEVNVDLLWSATVEV